MKQLSYFFSLFLFYSYTILFIFIIVFSVLSIFEYYYGLEIPFVEIFENRTKLHVPLLGLRINIPMNFSIVLMWIAMSYYLVYFFFVKEFSKVFIKSNSFEQKSLKRLRFFLKLNLIPLIYIAIFSVYTLVKRSHFRLEDDYFIVLAHTIIAFLIYLYLDILKKGRHIQEENDLTI